MAPNGGHGASAPLPALWFARPVLTLRPQGKRDQHYAGQTEPSDGVLQVIVLEMHVERAGFWDAAFRHRGLQVDVERRDLAPAQRLRHCKMVAHEPQPRSGIWRGRQYARAFRKADVARQRYRRT